MSRKILIKGAREHNLKNVDLEIPRDRLVVITGVSGSGKSSLAFDTLYAEGQRRYVESLSAQARHFMEQMKRPEVDFIDGLSPAIAIQQRGVSQNPRSTVGTVTEIYDYLRLLFARIGRPHCYQCGSLISVKTIQQIVDEILSYPPGTRVHILAPILSGPRGDCRRKLKELIQAGFARVKIDGELYELGEEISLKRGQIHRIDLVVDRLVLREGIAQRLADSLEVASRYSREAIKVEIFRDADAHKAEEIAFSQKFACVPCGVSFPEMTPSLFSFNSPDGACPGCGGLGVNADGEIERFAGLRPCAACRGMRLRKESLHVRIGSESIAEIVSLPIKEAIDFFATLTLSSNEQTIVQQLLKQIMSRLHFMVELGLDYLRLDRPTISLSGGEFQRIRLASQMGSNLAGVLYILDEPSIGLHQRDIARLLDMLGQLRDSGNTVLVVEHDQDTILAADHVIELGPGAGVNGGEVVAQGTPQVILAHDRSLTGQYLSGRKGIPIPMQRRKGIGKALVIKGATHNNLKGITVQFPVGALTCVTGVSGSGKSSLVVDTLYRALAQKLHGSKAWVGSCEGIYGWESFARAISVDQSPIGRTPRSNPGTYTGLFTHVRGLFAQLPEARVRGYRPARFSFNAKGGRCEACQGDGIIMVEMHFLPDLYVTCEVCSGRRYNRETLEIRYKGRSIADVLDLSVDHALGFLGHIPSIRHKLETLREVGLGYLALGQSALTLSGGEAQRIKLANELSKRFAGKTLYLLDEPTTGLHFDDIKKLLEVLSRLVEAGNTVVIIEHNPEVIKSADYVIDLGPEGGDVGGELVAVGTPEEICQVEGSRTGEALVAVLGSGDKKNNHVLGNPILDILSS